MWAWLPATAENRISRISLLYLFSLQRKNTIFGSRPRVERRLTSSTARGSSRMFYSFDEVTTDSDDDEDGEEVETVGGRGRRRQRQLRERVADDKVTRMRSLGNWWANIQRNFRLAQKKLELEGLKLTWLTTDLIEPGPNVPWYGYCAAWVWLTDVCNQYRSMPIPSKWGDVKTIHFKATRYECTSIWRAEAI